MRWPGTSAPSSPNSAAEEHDEAVALVSHVPQVVSSLVASRLQGTPLHALSLAGNGLRDVTRIAASDPTLWVQILGANADKVVEILHGVREDLNRLIGTLEDPTAPGARLDLAQLISEGNAGQSRIPGKHGGPPQAYSWLTVLVDDTPGTDRQAPDGDRRDRRQPRGPPAGPLLGTERGHGGNLRAAQQARTA